MREYLATLHRRSDSHKRHFAFAVAGSITLSIFAIWLFVNYGLGAAASTSTVVSNTGVVHEAGPVEALSASLSSSWDALSESFGELTKSAGGVDIQTGYDEMKNKTLDTYGR